MLRQEDFPEEYGPFCDIQNHNLVLQVMGYDDTYNTQLEQSRRSNLVDSLESLLAHEAKPEEHISDEEASQAADNIKKILDEKGKAFQHTPEYYAAIEDEQLRIKAYRGVKVVSTVLSGEDAEIAKNPFKFLNLSEDSTFGQVRSAWMRLSKIWYPDLIYPENRDQYDRIFGIDSTFPIYESNPEDWIKNLEKLEIPEKLDPEALEKMTTIELREYTLQHEKYQQKELEYETVKAEMRIRATKKMQTINKAYREAKKFFSDKESDSFAGFEWGEGETIPLFTYDYHNEFTYKFLKLEGEGEIRRDFGKWAIPKDEPYLSFDYGDLYMCEPETRQKFYLKPFFAWMELRQDKELSPLLLDDLKENYKLNDDQSEQLRLMIMNRESLYFISETLPIPKEEKYRLKWFIEEAYNGPEYYHLIGPRGDSLYPMGVEINDKGGLILSYKSQIKQCFSHACEDAQALFSPTDMQIMQAIAYGPLLQQMEEI